MICCPNKSQQPFKRKEELKELYFRASSSYNPREKRWSNKRIPCCNKTEKKEEKEGKLPRERLREFLCEWGPFIHKWMAMIAPFGFNPMTRNQSWRASLMTHPSNHYIIKISLILVTLSYN